jgi:TatA/E family protein of Tat protein translocase
VPNLSPIEIAVVALLALVVFGPEKLPDIARTIGRTFTQIRKMADEARSEFQAGFDEPAEEPVADEPEEEPYGGANPGTERPL